ncbi:hypothetical protein V6N11_083169 [Hibiscus sabdariffa]|uniref:Uncharacterized protein n=1 Tax=Hibiscus sabdariffa TaxID=183260 RepID=A0ABR2QL76_9ROSI
MHRGWGQHDPSDCWDSPSAVPVTGNHHGRRFGIWLKINGNGGSDGLMFGKEMGCSRLKVETGRPEAMRACENNTAVGDYLLMGGSISMVKWVNDGELVS